MSMNVFRFFRPPGGEEKEEKVEKRRAQVRRAQQTYRQRKDQYTRALEKEVSRLRSVEADLAHENQRLRDTVGAQQRLLTKKADWGGLWDSGLSSDEDVFKEGEGISPFSEQSQHNHIPSLNERTLDQQWALTSPGHTSQGRGQGKVQAQIQSEFGLAPLPFENGPSPSGFTPLQMSGTVDTPSHHCHQPIPPDPATTAAGVEFVLALESPCLGHIHGDPSNPNQANGHALTTSSYVLSMSQPQPQHQPPSSPSLPSSLPSSFPSPEYTAESNKAAIIKGLESGPRTILDRLLTLSTTFALEDEVTPVQAWDRIRKQMENYGIVETSCGSGWWKELVRRLAGLVKCHGFGAVLKVDLFEQVLREVMVGYPGTGRLGK